MDIICLKPGIGCMSLVAIMDLSSYHPEFLLTHLGRRTVPPRLQAIQYYIVGGTRDNNPVFFMKLLNLVKEGIDKPDVISHYSNMEQSGKCKFDFESDMNRRGTSCYKWDFDKRLTGREGLLPFWVADMDFRLAPEISRALKKRLDHGVFGYTAKPDSLDEALINWFSRQHHWRIKAPQILEIPGIVPFIYMFVREFTNPGDPVIIQEPVYYPFRKSLEKNHRKTAVNPLVRDSEGCWSMDLDNLSDLIDKTGAKTLIFCSPHNPVGRVWKKDELLNLADLCRHNDVMVVSDEIHADLIQPGYRHIPWLSLPEDRLPRSLALISPTKTFNIPGLTTAFSIIPDADLRNRCKNMLLSVGLGEGISSVFPQTAAEAAWREGGPWLKALLEVIGRNDAFLRRTLAEVFPGIHIATLEGTYLEWLYPPGMSGNLHEKLLDAGIWLSKGADFGWGGEDHLRMNIACPLAQLTKGLEMMTKVFTALQNP